MLLYAIDIKLAGRLALAVSLPTMLVAFARYSRDQSFQALAANRRFFVVMAAGSVTGRIIGALLLGAISGGHPHPTARLRSPPVLDLSSTKTWRHE